MDLCTTLALVSDAADFDSTAPEPVSVPEAGAGAGVEVELGSGGRRRGMRRGLLVIENTDSLNTFAEVEVEAAVDAGASAPLFAS